MGIDIVELHQNVFGEQPSVLSENACGECGRDINRFPPKVDLKISVTFPDTQIEVVASNICITCAHNTIANIEYSKEYNKETED